MKCRRTTNRAPQRRSPLFTEPLESRTLLCGFVHDESTVPGPHFIYGESATTVSKQSTTAAPLSSFTTLASMQTLAATAALPAGWSSQDIGSVAKVGSASLDEATGNFAVSGGGADVWSTADGFHFAYSTLTGNGQIVARVASVQNTNGLAKAGVMFRESMTPGSKNAFVQVKPTNGASFQTRDATGGTTANIGSYASGKAPIWLRLTRSGDTFIAARSSNGTTWVTIASRTIPMAQTLYIGLAVTAHDNAKINTSQFTNVGIAGAPLSVPTQLAVTQASSSSAVLTWNDTSSTETLFRIQRSTNGGSTWSEIGTTAANVATFTNTGLTATLTYSYRVRAEAGSTFTAWSSVATFKLNPTLELTGGDIGFTGKLGSNSVDTTTGVFTVAGAGADVWGTSDALRFVQQQLTGDGSIIVRVASIQTGINDFTKAGVMFRESLASNSKNVFLSLTPMKGTMYSSRKATGGSTVGNTTAGSAVPTWLKLQRIGNTYIGSTSADGVTWKQTKSVTFAMNSTIYVGLAVTSHVKGTLATATFDNVSRSTASAWLALADAPIARYEHAGLTVAGKLWSFGGFYNTAIETTRRSDVYDPATNTWTQIADMPEHLTHVGNATDGRYIYFVGGFLGNYAAGLPTTNHAWRYDTTTNTWSALPNLPESIGAGAAAIVNNTLYFFGGTKRSAGKSTADSTKTFALRLDVAGAIWTTKTGVLPVARNHLGGVAVNGLIYAIGGQKLGSEITGNVNTVNVYNPATDKWSTVASLPIATGHIVASTFAYNGKIRVIGGVTQNSAEVDTVFEYNISTNIWTTLGPIPGKRQSPLADAINGVIYITGGFEPGVIYTSTFRSA